MFGLAALAVGREELVAALPLLRMRRRAEQCGLLRFLAIGLELTLHFGALARDVDVHARFKTEQQWELQSVVQSYTLRRAWRQRAALAHVQMVQNFVPMPLARCVHHV